jgi:hypothetical protein
MGGEEREVVVICWNLLVTSGYEERGGVAIMCRGMPGNCRSEGEKYSRLNDL